MKEDFEFFIKHQIGITHILFRFLTNEKEKQKLSRDYYDLCVFFIENIEKISKNDFGKFINALTLFFM